jgi:ABC-2 type transport system ATP-binding protein
MIAATGLTRRFGSRVAVEDVTFGVARSEIVALLGPNGAGKTTTLRMLAGLIAPTAGEITIDSIRLGPRTAGPLRARIGFLTEAPGLWDRLSVRENLRVYARLHGVAHADVAVDRMLDTFGLGSRASARASELSKGMRQKVAVARALLHEPAILLLDEPTSGLDPEITRSVRALLDERRASGCAILVSTHNLDEAERLANRVAVLDRRLLALDSPAVLRQRLMTGRVTVRVGGDAAPLLHIVRTVDPAAVADGSTLTFTVEHGDRDTASIVRGLVLAGADVLEVQPEIPALEDAYMRLVGAAPSNGRNQG